MSRALAIVGMHRSGTSLTASWLAACGLQLDDGGIVPPGPGNPRGHFEDLDLVRLHRRSLRRQYPGSRGWAVATEASGTSFSRLERARAKQIAWRRRRLARVWAWKDPRTTLFLPEWERIESGLVVLGLWRPACDVADSLLRRGEAASDPAMRIARQEAVAVWLVYNRALLDHASRVPDRTLVVRADALFQNDRSIFAMLSDWLGISAQSYRPISEQIDPDLFATTQPSIQVSAEVEAMESDLAEISTRV